jgi:hypothetical protein
MNTAPKIESLGAPPEKHAERVTREMVAFLHAERPQLEAKAKGMIDPRQMGTHKGLERTADRLIKALGPLALSVYVARATRGRGMLLFADWGTWDPIAGKEAAWLAGFLTTLRATNYVLDLRSNARLLVSRHAIARLAERADVRTVEHLLLATRALWTATFQLMTRNPDGWLTPCRLPLPGGQIAILEPDRSGEPRLVTKTILDAP